MDEVGKGLDMNCGRLLGLSLFVLVTIAGCGDGRPKRVKVSGIVVIDDQPLTRGFISFVPEEARSSFSLIGEDGRFTMTCYEEDDGIISGTHKVAVTCNEPLGETGMKWWAPKKYSDAQTSGLEYTIEEDTPDLRIELTWDGGKPFTTGRKTSRNPGKFLEE